MAVPTPTVDPIKNSTLWHGFTLKGVLSPGTIPKGGVKGFKRSWGWDKKKGKGTAGATLTLTSAPVCEGTITIQLFTTQDFADWDAFVSTVLSIQPEQQKTSGLDIFYPGFSSIGLTTVVVESYSPPEHQGKGLYHAEIKLIEWSPPPAVNVSSTPDSTAPDQGDPTTAPPQDSPRNQAKKAEIAALNKAAAAP